MQRSTIYTGTGDAGSTGLADGNRIDKSSQRIAAIGSIDELNAALGLALATPELERDVAGCLSEVQNTLFVIGALLASATGLQLAGDAVAGLEQAIDNFDADLPDLTQFILPGGSRTGAQLHFARTVCRRAEREVLHLAASEAVESAIPIYLNRLSDLLFVAARLVNRQAGEKEHTWNP